MNLAVMAVAPQEVRTIARVFSPAILQRLIDPRVRHQVLGEIVRLSYAHGLPTTTVGKALSAAYERLVEEYRNEHVYKEAATNWWLRRSGNRATAGMLFELRTGFSKLDVLCGARVSHAIEIKTDFDQPTRLSKQLASYYLRFPRVSLLVSRRALRRFDSLVPGYVGLMSLSDRGIAQVERTPIIRSEDLNSAAMVSMLRKEEVIALGASLDVDLTRIPNMRLKAALLREVSRVQVAELSGLIARQMGRRSQHVNVGSLRVLPSGVRSLVIKAGLSQNQTMQLREVLELPLEGV